jgi:hypothetical protein
MSSISSFPTSISHLKDSIEKTDDDGSLQIYSYQHCDNHSCSDLKKCRGLIFNGDSLVCNSLGFTPEYNDSDKNLLSSESIEKYTFFPSEEGTLIRVFYNDDNNKWYVSTHRKLDAFRSRWGCNQSFGEIFENSLKEIGFESIDHLTQKLQKEHTYLFFIRNTLHNKVVSNPSQTSENVYFVGCMVDHKTFDFNCPHSFDFPTQKRLEFTNWDDVFQYVSQVNPLEKQGVIAFWKENGNTTQMKIVNSKYQLFCQVRGNEPNLKLRYLQVRSNPVYSKLIYDIYPEHMNEFLTIENAIVKIAKSIHNSYISRFVNKIYTVVSPQEYRIIQECHGWHIQDRVKNKVSLGKVISVLSLEQFVSTLYYLLSN